MNIKDDWTIYTHHLTVLFGKEAKIWSSDNRNYLGMKIPMVTSSLSFDDKAIAVVVEIPQHLPKDLQKYLTLKIPHITIATAPDTKPVYSNEMLKSNMKKSVDFRVNVEGVLQFQAGYLGIVLNNKSVEELLSKVKQVR